MYLNILNSVESDFYVCHNYSTTNAILKSAVSNSLEKHPHNIVSKDAHPSETCC